MFKNTAATFRVFAFDSATGLPKSGDAANITAYVSKDYGAPTVLGDTSATEEDATNAKGYYTFTAAQAETNADCLMISAKSSTSGIVVVGAPAVIYTRPQTGWLAPTTAGRTLDVSSTGEAGIDWANVGSPTTTLALTGTTIADTQKVDLNTIKTQSVTATSAVNMNNIALIDVALHNIGTVVWGDIYSNYVTPGTFGYEFITMVQGIASLLVGVNVVQISGDSTAADNLESYLDGTNFMPVDAYKPKFSVSGTTLTVKKPDGTTTAYTKTLTTDSGAEPVVGSS